MNTQVVRKRDRITAVLLGFVFVLGAGSAGVFILRFAARVVPNSALSPGLRLVAALLTLIPIMLILIVSSALWRNWIHQGITVSFHPREPRAGDAFEVRWMLPPRAAEALAQRPRVCLRVAQYRIADAVSGTSESRVQDFALDIPPYRQPDGGLLLQGRFELPPDAPTHDSLRSGELVNWRLELLGPDDTIKLVEPIPVQAATPASELDRFAPDRRASKVQEEIPKGSVDERMPTLPPGVRVREDADALVLAFSQTAWRLLCVVALAAAVGLSAIGRGEPIFDVLCAVLLALSLHAISRQETLQVRDDALIVSCNSWLWRRRVSLPAHVLTDHLYQQLNRGSFAQQTPDSWTLWSRGGVHGSQVRLTPRFRGRGATEIAHMLRWAHAQRNGRFSAGSQRTEAINRSAPGWGWSLWLLILAALQAY